MRRVIIFLRNRFVEGLLLVGPLLVVFFILKWLFQFLHRFLESLVVVLHLQSVVKLNLWILEGATLLVLMGLLIAFNLLLKTVLGKMIRRVLEQFFEGFPLVGSLYGAVKQISKMFFSDQGEKIFQEVVQVDFPGDRTKSIGFLVGKMERNVLPNELQDKGLMVVYIPTAPLPTTGYLLILEERYIQHTSLTIEQAVKIVFSGGILDGD